MDPPDIKPLNADINLVDLPEEEDILIPEVDQEVNKKY